MKPFSRGALLAPTLALIALGSAPARADFYTLEGRFQCLEKPNAVCYDATPSWIEPPAPRAAAKPPAQSVAHADAKTGAPAASAKPPLEPILAIASRIKSNRPESGDVGTLKRMAGAGDARALELLAWCELRGIGTARDPVEAYRVYGEAAAANVPHALENQALVYEQSLTQEERERILEIEARPRTAELATRTSDGRPNDVP